MNRFVLNSCLVASLLASIAKAGPTTAPTTQPGVMHVVIFRDGGAPDKSGDTVQACLDKMPGRFDIKYINGDDVRNGVLDHADVAVFPGGSGSAQAKSLQDTGREKVKQFVQDGGGYLGICGGAYLATSFYPWSLHILNAAVVDREHWARGRGVVKLQFTDDGKSALSESVDSVDCMYHQGPLLAPAHEPGLPAYEPLATFGSEVAENGAPKGVMIGTTAMARSTYGKGRIILISPHPEATEGLDGIIRSVVLWIGDTSADKTASNIGK